MDQRSRTANEEEHQRSLQYRRAGPAPLNGISWDLGPRALYARPAKRSRWDVLGRTQDLGAAVLGARRRKEEAERRARLVRLGSEIRPGRADESHTQAPPQVHVQPPQVHVQPQQVHVQPQQGPAIRTSSRGVSISSYEAQIRPQAARLPWRAVPRRAGEVIAQGIRPITDGIAATAAAAAATGAHAIAMFTGTVHACRRASQMTGAALLRQAGRYRTGQPRRVPQGAGLIAVAAAVVLVTVGPGNISRLYFAGGTQAADEPGKIAAGSAPVAPSSPRKTVAARVAVVADALPPKAAGAHPEPVINAAMLNLHAAKPGVSRAAKSQAPVAATAPDAVTAKRALSSTVVAALNPAAIDTTGPNAAGTGAGRSPGPHVAASMLIWNPVPPPRPLPRQKTASGSPFR